jgi:leucyl-tRNA---protein transferase
VRFLELKDTVTSCPYLPDRDFIAENFLAPNLNSPQIDRLLAAGFRHFGSYYFRPVCRQCQKCVPIRVRIGQYRPTRSFRRALNQNGDLIVTIAPPSPTLESYSLYRKHQLRFEHRSDSSYEQYVRSFCSPTFGNAQLSVFDGVRLVSVLHLDVTSISVSAVYCYYETDLTERGLGTFSILSAIQYAAELQATSFYLGYVVEGNRHMMYKSRYRPNEILANKGWVSYRDSAGQTRNVESYDAGFPGRDFRAAGPFSRILLDPIV